MWVTPPATLVERVLELVPRDDRHADRRVFDQITGDQLRTALTRAATPSRQPRRTTFDTAACRFFTSLAFRGRGSARAVGHDDDITTTSRVCTHVLADETEIVYEASHRGSMRGGEIAVNEGDGRLPSAENVRSLERAHAVLPSVLPPRPKMPD